MRRGICADHYSDPGRYGDADRVADISQFSTPRPLDKWGTGAGQQLLEALIAAYAHWPLDMVNDGKVITFFVLLGTGFTLLFEPGRRSLGAALRHVFDAAHFRHRTSRVDMLHFALMAGLWIPLTSAAVTAFLTTDIANHLAAQFGPRTAWLGDGWLLATAQFVVLLAARDFGTYVAHRLLHQVPLLWSIHRAHHSAEALTFFTSTRAHPLEYLHMQAFIAIFGGLGGGAFLYLTGSALHTAPLLLLIASSIFFETFGLAQHSHLPISFGKLNYLFVAPVMHQLHHSAELRHRDRNFAAQLAIFDWIFGTIYVPKAREEYRLGLNDAELGANNPHVRLRDFYLEPAWHAWRLVTAAVRAR